MKLNEIALLDRDKKKRVGRGGARGKTSGRGQKGQNSRSGSSRSSRFEGGQMPLVQRLPKLRGFKSLNKKESVSIKSLEKFKDGTEITKEFLAREGIIKNISSFVKIVGNEGLTKKLKTSLPMTPAASKFFEKEEEGVKTKEKAAKDIKEG